MGAETYCKAPGSLANIGIGYPTWLNDLVVGSFEGPGRQDRLSCDLEAVRHWRPRLRSVEREFFGGRQRDRMSRQGGRVADEVI